MNTAVRCTCCIYPAVLHKAVASISNTCRGKRTRDTEIIDATAKFAKQRVVEAVDMVAVTMQVTCKAVGFVANRCPRACMLDVGMHDELQVLTSLDVLVEYAMTFKRPSGDYTIGYLSRIFVEQT